MISLAKILFTVAAVIGVWTVFRAVRRWVSGPERLSPAERAAQAARASVKARWSRQGQPPEPPAPPAADLDLDLVRCPACGTYGPRGQSCPCGGSPRDA